MATSLYRDEHNPKSTRTITIIVLVVIAVVVLLFVGLPLWNVWRAELSGKATLARAQSARRVLVTQAQAELDASVLRAKAIATVGAAAKAYPEYRQQEFVAAFAEALQGGDIQQIVYVPTEANIPIIEAGRIAHSH